MWVVQPPNFTCLPGISELDTTTKLLLVHAVNEASSQCGQRAPFPSVKRNRTHTHAHTNDKKGTFYFVHQKLCVGVAKSGYFGDNNQLENRQLQLGLSQKGKISFWHTPPTKLEMLISTGITTDRSRIRYVPRARFHHFVDQSTKNQQIPNCPTHRSLPKVGRSPPRNFLNHLKLPPTLHQSQSHQHQYTRNTCRPRQLTRYVDID